MESNSVVKLLGVYRTEGTSGDVHLLELLINASPNDVNVSSFMQENDTLPEDNWQAAYDEHFLNENGTEVIGTFIDQDNLTGDKTRIVFFMYFINFNKPLLSQYGDIILSAPMDMPERLSKIIHFEPVD